MCLKQQQKKPQKPKTKKQPTQVRGIWEISAPSLQFYCNSKIMKVFFFKEIKGWHGER